MKRNKVYIQLAKNGMWLASIVRNGKTKTKTFNNEEDAILQSYIWQLNYKITEDRIEDIKEKYPRLVEASEKGYLISEDVELVKGILFLVNKNEYCPCQREKSERTKCMCLNFIESDDEWCHCGLYRRVKE